MFSLDPVPQYRLSNPPLVQALAQVRFPIVAKVVRLEGIAPFQEALREVFPYMEQIVERSVEVDLAGETNIKTDDQITWHFTDDEGFRLVVGTNIMTLSVDQQYQGIDDFATRFSRCLEIAQTHLSLQRCDRIGVRFLDVVPDTEDPEVGWHRWFKNEIVGWPTSRITEGSTRLENSVSQTHLTADNSDSLAIYPSAINAVIRHGIANARSIIPGIPPVTLGNRSFFLDLDFFVTAPQLFSIESINTQIRGLHSQADRFFRWSLTPEGEDEFGLKELP